MIVSHVLSLPCRPLSACAWPCSPGRAGSEWSSGAGGAAAVPARGGGALRARATQGVGGHGPQPGRRGAVPHHSAGSTSGGESADEDAQRQAPAVPGM
ncbi:unnamed protein product [Closterium sp. NIES-54]